MHKKKSIQQCRTLSEYRQTVLREPQTKVARRARCHQAYVSRVERGHLPRPWNRDPLLNAYDLAEEEFVRMVETARLQREIRKPVPDEYPLFAVSTNQPVPIERLETNAVSAKQA